MDKLTQIFEPFLTLFPSLILFVGNLFAALAVLIKVGVPASSLIAAFATAGLAIALSLKDTLSNIAAGIMLLVLRPLEVGEYVCLGGSASEVRFRENEARDKPCRFIY